MDKVIGFRVSFFEKLDGDIVGFRGENLMKAKWFKFYLFFLFHMFVFYYGVSMGIRSG
jgi:hypothetical protein